MTSKQWLAAFVASVLLLGAGILGFNYVVDPFGVFGHEVLSWPSYEMTINPRTAKMTYIQKHHDEYDSYILGGSSTSSFPVDTLNKALDAKFYNMIMYGSDMLDVEQASVYLLNNCEVKNLVVNVYLDNARDYNVEANPLSYAMPPAATGEPSLPFYAKYLFMDPRHSRDKLKAMREDTYLTQPFDVFNPETGAYDKKVRDAEPVGNMDQYLEAYPVFQNYPEADGSIHPDAVKGTMESLTHIRDLCAEKGVNFMVFCAPVYIDYFNYFNWDDVADFYTQLAQITPYWDFTLSSVSYEPRYFYDETHFRNCVGDMALSKVFDDDSIYRPDDFGAYVTAETIQDHLNTMRQAAAKPVETYTADVPVLMYHHIDAQGNDTTTITPELFEAQIAALAEQGYHSVFPDDLRAYVEQGKPLPEKPIVITFDDGYLSNYEYGWPILERYGMCATIFMVGSTTGNVDHYKDTEFPITPHFSYEQGREMRESGSIHLQSHTYDMHQWGPYEDHSPARETILRFEGESEADYRDVLAADCEKSRQTIMEGTGEPEVRALAYPQGAYDPLAQVTLMEHGYDITFSTAVGSNTLIKGHPQSLLGLHRFTMSEAVSVEDTLSWVSSARN